MAALPAAQSTTCPATVWFFTNRKWVKLRSAPATKEVAPCAWILNRHQFASAK